MCRPWRHGVFVLPSRRAVGPLGRRPGRTKKDKTSRQSRLSCLIAQGRYNKHYEC